MEPPIGLIAAGGQLPVLTARGIRAAGRAVACVGLRDQFDPVLPELCDRFAAAGIIQLGRWIRLLKRFDVQEAVMVGRLAKVRIYEPLRWFRQLPDWRALDLWYRKLRHDRRNYALLSAVSGELAEAGITLIDSTRYISDLLADEGAMTSKKPSAEQQADIEFGLPIIRQMGALDVGQSIAVKEREVIAVEAIEGTDGMIERAGKLCRSGGWTLIKIAKSDQDMRLDVPTIGLGTIENLKRQGGVCLAVEAGKVIMLDKPQVLEAAQRTGIALIGVRVSAGA